MSDVKLLTAEGAGKASRESGVVSRESNTRIRRPFVASGLAPDVKHNRHSGEGRNPALWCLYILVQLSVLSSQFSVPGFSLVTHNKLLSSDCRL